MEAGFEPVLWLPVANKDRQLHCSLFSELFYPPAQKDIFEHVTFFFFSQDTFPAEGVQTLRNVGSGFEPKAPARLFRCKQWALEHGGNLRRSSLMQAIFAHTQTPSGRWMISNGGKEWY